MHHRGGKERMADSGMTLDTPSRAASPRVAERRPAGSKCVLIVEDNDLNMKLFNDLLTARAHRPNLILMDIQLPEVSGLEVTKWLKDDDDLASIPVVAVTAFAMKGDEQRILRGGCEAYISKPISMKLFIETVAKFAGEAAARV
jgi:two-component system, cell cycle response regulator DivK